MQWSRIIAKRLSRDEEGVQAEADINVAAAVNTGGGTTKHTHVSSKQHVSIKQGPAEPTSKEQRHDQR